MMTELYESIFAQCDFNATLLRLEQKEGAKHG
jgi:hypothetical protein